MDYLVIAPDGQEYGPANLDTLRQWVEENRISQATELKNFISGQVVKAGTLAELFPPTPVAPPMAAAPPAPGPPPLGAAGLTGDWSKPPSPYARATPGPLFRPGLRADNGNGDVWFALGGAALGLVLFFTIGRLTIFIPIAAVAAGCRAVQKGNRLGYLAASVAIVALVVVALGWFNLFGHMFH